MASGNQLLSITTEAYANIEANIGFCESSQLHYHHSSGSGYSDPCSLNSTLTANEGSANEEDGILEPCLSSPMPPLECLHCERISSECICLDSEEEDLQSREGKVQSYSSSGECLYELREPVQHSVGNGAINHVNLPPVRYPNSDRKQMFERQQHLEQPSSEVHRPLPSFEQLLASLGLRAGFVIHRNRHQKLIEC